jgi:hypothetical protein
MRGFDFLAGKVLVSANRRRMNDTSLVAYVLVAGGIVFLSTFMWITVTRVRELPPPTRPPDHH